MNKEKEKKVGGGSKNPFKKIKWNKTAVKAALEKRAYIGCSFFIPIIIFWLVYICFEVYPFGNGSVLVLDLNGQYVYFFEALRNAIHGDMSLIYSWSRSLGGEFIGIYAYYLASPLSYLVALFPEGHITEGLLFLILLKTGISGATMSFYLKKTRPETKDTVAIIFSVMYALSAYAVTYAHNTMWIDAMMLLPLVIYGLEQLVDKQKFVLFIVTMTLTLVSTFYIGYMMCFFVFIYFFYYYFSHAVFKENNYYGEKLRFLKSLLRVGAAAVICVLCACIIILPTYHSLTFGKTTFTKTEWKFTMMFDLLDLFTKALPGSYDTVRPEGLPFIYCGTLALIMLPMFFISKKIKTREKIGGAAIIFVMLFIMSNFATDTFMHGLQRPMWLNCRYSFAFIFLVLVFACRAFNGLKTFDLRYLCLVGGGIIGLVLVVQKFDYEYLDDYFCIWFTILCVVVYLVSIRFVIVKNMSNITLTVLAVIVCLELFGSSLLSSIALDKDVGMSSREGYVTFFDRVDGIVEAVQDSDDSFYRMEKSFCRSVCDEMKLNMRGIGCSTSTLNASVVELLNRLGYSSTAHWSQYAGGNMVSDSLVGLKYIITESDTESELLTPYLSDPDNDLYAYFNEYALSMAYSASRDIGAFDTSIDVSPFEMLNNMVTALLGSDETIELYKPIEHSVELTNAVVSYNGPVYETKVIDGEEVTVSTDYYFYKPRSSGGQGVLTYSFSVDPAIDNADVYFYFCTNYPRKVEWELIGADSDGDGSLFGDKGDCVQSLGVLQSGDYDLKVTMNEDDNIFYIIKDSPIFYYLDHDVFDAAFKELAKGNWNIDKGFTDTHLTGSVTVKPGDEIIFTTIPYDEGWNVYVDGEKTETYRVCTALLGFDITEGTHTIEMRYRSKEMVYGLLFCVIGTFLFAAWIVLDRLVLEKRRVGKHEQWEEKLKALELEKAEAAELEAAAAELENAEAAEPEKAEAVEPEKAEDPESRKEEAPQSDQPEAYESGPSGQKES